MTEKRIQLAALATGAAGLLLVWYLVDALWAEGWSMRFIHLIAILGAAVVTLAASLIVVLVVKRYRRILEAKNAELQRLASIGATVAGLAHYQKNLLNGLRGGLYITDGAMEKGDLERLRAGWRMLNDSILRIERLTMDMLYYIKPRAMKREPTDINQVIEEVIEMMQETAAGRRVELSAQLDPVVDPQPLDRTAIYRSLLNLVSNAVDASAESEGGGRVTLRSAVTPGEIVVSVKDNGIGMNDEVLSSLFTRFYSTKGGKGTGLGLVVVKEVLEQHGASVDVESKVGRGSAFHIHFPRTDVTSDDRIPLSDMESKGERNAEHKAHTYSRGSGRNQPISVTDS